MLELARLLQIPHAQAVGLATALWAWATEQAPTGCLSAFPNSEIAVMSLWYGDPDAFIEALIKAKPKGCEAGLLERTSDAKLCIHDWREHCEKYVHQRLDRNRLRFWDGGKPFNRKTLRRKSVTGYQPVVTTKKKEPYRSRCLKPKAFADTDAEKKRARIPVASSLVTPQTEKPDGKTTARDAHVTPSSESASERNTRMKTTAETMEILASSILSGTPRNTEARVKQFRVDCQCLNKLLAAAQVAGPERVVALVAKAKELKTSTVQNRIAALTAWAKKG